jgi:dolichyl-phosphate beta-glucosyltransferase
MIPAFADARIALTMPVYNEGRVIDRVVRECHDYVRQYAHGEVVVVEDGSTDGTKETLALLRDELGITCVASERRKGAARGQKDALRACLERGADVVLITDSDGQHDPRDFDLLLRALETCDMAIGQRTDRAHPTARRLGSWAWSAYVEALFGLALRDVNCGFRAIRGSVLEGVLSANETFPECVLTELSIRAHAAGYRQVEVPIQHFARDGKPTAWRKRQLPGIAASLVKSSLELMRELG